jgi:metal-responsive CopG/Arc/MetJ family transcriptional regulator
MVKLIRSIVFDVPALEIVDRLAEEEERSRSQVVRRLIRQEAQRRGLLPGHRDAEQRQEAPNA